MSIFENEKNKEKQNCFWYTIIIVLKYMGNMLLAYNN